MPNITGSTITSDKKGFQPRPSTTSRARNAARMLRSPWARLTRRMTPKMSDRPVANSA